MLVSKYTYLRNKRMRRCGVDPPPIIFERLKLPQQIIYRRKENLSESPNHQKYWENILVSRFYEQFSRNRRNLGHFRKFEKISNSQNMNILYIILKHVIWRFQIYNPQSRSFVHLLPLLPESRISERLCQMPHPTWPPLLRYVVSKIH